MGGAGAEERRVVDDVAVDDRQIQVAVVVEVEERDAEADERQRGRPEAALHRGVGEDAAAVVAEQAVRLELVVGHDEIEPSVAVVVGELGAHAGARLAVARHRDARREADLGEAAAALVVEEEVRHRVVGHEHVGQPVVVVVADGHAEAVADVRGDAGGGADVGEDALAVVAVEHARPAPCS